MNERQITIEYIPDVGTRIAYGTELSMGDISYMIHNLHYNYMNLLGMEEDKREYELLQNAKNKLFQPHDETKEKE